MKMKLKEKLEVVPGKICSENEVEREIGGGSWKTL